MRSTRLHAVTGLALLALALFGCSSKSVKITGKIVKGGKPLIVSEDTYVTLQFYPDAGQKLGDTQVSSYNAKFDHKTGTYSVEIPPGKYRTKLIVALPSKGSSDGKLNAPSPVDSPKSHDLTKSQELDIDVPGK